MWKVTIRGILSKKARFFLTAFAVILGVAFVSGTFVLTATISRTFDGLFTEIYAHTDAVVQAKTPFKDSFTGIRPLLPASMVDKVRQVPGVADAEGTVSGYAGIVNKSGKLVNQLGAGPPSLGFSFSSDRQLSSFTLVSGHGPQKADDVVIDKGSASKAGYHLGDRIPIITKAGRADYTLVGLAKFGSSNSLLGASLSAFTGETAGRVLGEPGKVGSINVQSTGRVSQTVLASRIRTVVAGHGSGVEVLTGKEITAQSQNTVKDMLGFFNTFLLIFGIVALLVGSFIIFNTFSIIVAQRTRELALLRAIGAVRRQVIGSVVFEAVLVGVVASVLGLIGGVGLAVGLKALLALLGIDIPAGGVVVPATAYIWAFATGILVTTVASVLPAMRASRVPPMAAMRDVSVDRSGTSRRRVVIGAVVTIVGVLLLVGGLRNRAGNAAAVGLGAFVIFIGVTVLAPIVARPFSDALGVVVRRVKGITGTLATQNAGRNPARTASTASALMIGVALVVFITVFGASARASVSAAIDRSMKADYVITGGSFGQAGLPLELEQKLSQVSAVTSVSGVRSGDARIDGKQGQLIGVDPAKIDDLFDLEVTHGDITTLSPTGIAVQEHTASNRHLKVGSIVRMEFPQSAAAKFTVQTLYKQAGAGNWVISLGAFDAHYPSPFDAQIYLQTRGGATPANRAAINGVLRAYPGGTLQDRAQFKASQAKQIDQFLNLVYVLLFFAIFIALFGIANTLGLSIIERTHELGLLRAVGMTRAQVRSSVRWESVIIALLGTALGLVVGVFFGWALVSALADQGFSNFSAAPGQLVVIVILAAIFGVIAALRPARRAAKLDVLRAIITE